MSLVRLTEEEIQFAAIAGALRRAGAVAKQIPERYGRDRDTTVEPWRIDIEGVAAEMAVAKLLDRYWSPSLHVQRNSHESDVATFQIRSTQVENGCLILHERDRDDAYFVLVRGSMPTLDVVGWIRAEEGKKAEYVRDPRGRNPAFFVPADRLNAFPERS